MQREDFPEGTEGEIEFVRASLQQHQKEVVAICKQYDKIMLKHKRTNGWVEMDQNNSEFGLIKKAITLISSLEELVSHSAAQIQKAAEEAAERHERECGELRDKVEILEKTND